MGYKLQPLSPGGRSFEDRGLFYWFLHRQDSSLDLKLSFNNVTEKSHTIPHPRNPAMKLKDVAIGWLVYILT